MTIDEIQALLKERKLVLDQLQEINDGYDNMADSILTPKIREELAAIEEERKSATEGSNENLSNLESAIKSATIELGKSVKAEGFGHAVFTKGRKSWDTASLEKRMKEEQYSWLANYLEIGDPSCSIRKA